MNVYQKFSKIKLVAFDVDGVLTNSGLLATEANGLERTMNTRDGYILKKAANQGIHVAIITKGSSDGTANRLKNLGVPDVYYKVKDKLIPYEELKAKYNLADEEILYMGDDISDIPVLQKVGVAACPANAAVDVMKVCNYISPEKGGEFCVRDITERVLRLNGLM